MPVTEAQKRATAKYEKENYDKVLVRFPKGTKKRIQNVGAESVNGYIIKCVLDSLNSAQNNDICTGISKEVKTTKEPINSTNKPNISELYNFYGEKIHDIYTQIEIQEKYGNETLILLSKYAKNKE